MNQPLGAKFTYILIMGLLILLQGCRGDEPKESPSAEGTQQQPSATSVTARKKLDCPTSKVKSCKELVKKVQGKLRPEDLSNLVGRQDELQECIELKRKGCL